VLIVFEDVDTFLYLVFVLVFKLVSYHSKKNQLIMSESIFRKNNSNGELGEQLVGEAVATLDSKALQSVLQCAHDHIANFLEKRPLNKPWNVGTRLFSGYVNICLICACTRACKTSS
jgi:hypothetical protein